MRSGARAHVCVVVRSCACMCVCVCVCASCLYLCMLRLCLFNTVCIILCHCVPDVGINVKTSSHLILS